MISDIAFIVISATVAGLLVYLFVAEPIVVRIQAFSDWTMYLPAPAASALTQVSPTNQDFLAPVAGPTVAHRSGLMLALVGAYLTIRHDVT